MDYRIRVINALDFSRATYRIDPRNQSLYQLGGNSFQSDVVVKLDAPGMARLISQLGYTLIDVTAIRLQYRDQSGMPQSVYENDVLVVSRRDGATISKTPQETAEWSSQAPSSMGAGPDMEEAVAELRAATERYTKVLELQRLYRQQANDPKESLTVLDREAMSVLIGTVETILASVDEE